MNIQGNHLQGGFVLSTTVKKMPMSKDPVFGKYCIPNQPKVYLVKNTGEFKYLFSGLLFLEHLTTPLSLIIILKMKKTFMMRQILKYKIIKVW